MTKRVLGVITARGGSKSIPGKNIKLFAGKPLIAHTIEAAQKAGVFDQAAGGASRLILSTDDEKIAEIAISYGCDVPFMRPKDLAEDTTPHLSVMQHAVKWMGDHEDYEPDYAMILQPTSPLRQPFHIKEAVDFISREKADSLVSVSLVPKHFHPDWQFVKDTGNRLKMFTGVEIKNITRRRQDLSDTYFKNGAIFLFKTELLFASAPSIYGDEVLAYVMDEKYNANIDTMEDWERTEEMFKKNKQEI